MEVSRQRHLHWFLSNPKCTVQGWPEPDLCLKMHTSHARGSTWTHSSMLNVQEALCDFVFLMTSREKDHGLHFGDTRRCLLGLQQPQTEATGLASGGGRSPAERLPCPPGLRPPPTCPSTFRSTAEPTTKHLHPTGSFFFCILTTAQKRLDRFTRAYC